MAKRSPEAGEWNPGSGLGLTILKNQRFVWLWIPPQRQRLRILQAVSWTLGDSSQLSLRWGQFLAKKYLQLLKKLIRGLFLLDSSLTFNLMDYFCIKIIHNFLCHELLTFILLSIILIFSRGMLEVTVPTLISVCSPIWTGQCLLARITVFRS